MLVYGKGKCEPCWRVISIVATSRRNLASPWPLLAGACITWTDSIIAVGWDFAEHLLLEQFTDPASRTHPVEVRGGRLRDESRRRTAGESVLVSASEIMAHECGHTWQAKRMGGLYWLVGALTTLCREGPYWWNRFENQASESGLFGGIVNNSVCPELVARLRPDSSM